MAGLYLLLGTNLGNREENLKMARVLLISNVGPLVRSSSVYISEPWGMNNVPAFLNQLLLLDTDSSPLDILKQILLVESKMGRTRQSGYQSRIIDIDIIYYHQQVIDHPDLTLPHPRIKERKFVLKPLVELAPDFIHPVLQLTNQQLLDQCPDRLSVKPI
ncbi:MAG: 2-amino-4-hydroxy-6-hydroxymethyldihydropteridine diphosphokinase [Cyclobacteriaceae bacterium]|nr:MAG: 2-amino-4-hydroxy-6-hydroxymethyldihydropteridine diphosphokinase [Cyclobacteriaceae bacterium]